MTKATALMITSRDKTIISREFVGRMDLSGDSDGRELLEVIRSISCPASFVAALRVFNRNTYGADELLLCYRVKRFKQIIFNPQTYRRDWYADFLYLVNAGNGPIPITDADNKRFIIWPGEIIILFCGRFYYSCWTKYQIGNCRWSKAETKSLIT